MTFRDIKPENFMLKSKGDPSCVKMIDFGLSKDFSGQDTMSTMSGSVSRKLIYSDTVAVLHCSRGVLAKLQLQDRHMVVRSGALHYALWKSALSRQLRTLNHRQRN